MRLATLAVAAHLLIAGSCAAQDFPVPTKVAFITILATGSLDPRNQIDRPTPSQAGHITTAFVYPDSCMLRYKSYLRLQKEAVALLTQSFIGADSLKGYTSADYVFYDQPTGRRPLEMWKEHFRLGEKDTFYTPQQRLDLLRCIMPFASVGTVTDTSIQLTLREIPCFSPALGAVVARPSLSLEMYMHVLSGVLHFYVLKGKTIAANIVYERQNGKADLFRFDQFIPYDAMLHNGFDAAH